MNTATLIKLYPMMSNKRIGEILGVTKSYVGVTAHRLGLRKDASYLSEVNSKNSNRNGKRTKQKVSDYGRR